MQTLTSAQMKALEKYADLHGLSYTQMMENAGSAAAQFIFEHTRQKSVFLFVGKGNNGGDGYVAARILAQKKMKPLIIQAEGLPKTQDSILNYQLAKDMLIPMTEQIPPLDDGIIVDCIYGTGFHAPFSPQARKYAQSINASRLPVFALDIPSGVNADDGTFDEDAVKADFTISFDSLKPAHILVSSLPFCSKIICASIGITEHWRREALKNS